MSTWRRKALEFLPELRTTIEKSENPTMLWIDLYFEFETAVQNSNEDFIKRTVKYLTWCTSDAAGDISSETQQAVYCGFLEDIANKRKYWPFFNSWFNNAQFHQYKGSFQYALSDKEFIELENMFNEK